MHKVCKIRCYPNQTQIDHANRIFGICRFVRNKYIECNRISYEEGNGFISGYDFSKYINKLKISNIEYEFIQECSSKAIKDAIMIQERAYKKAFKKLKSGIKCNLPHFISRKRLRSESFFFIKDAVHFNTGLKNIIKIPILGHIRITQRNQLPYECDVTSGRFIKEDAKYYLMFIYKTEPIYLDSNDYGMGIDLGIKSYASIYFSNGNSLRIESFRNDKRYQSLLKKYKKLQQIISKKSDINYNRLLHRYLDENPDGKISDKIKNIMKGESYNTSSIKKLQKKCRSIYRKITNIRHDFINKLVYYLVVRLKPEYITIENLSVSQMLSNESDMNGKHRLHELLSETNLSYFSNRLIQKCGEFITELRIANQYFASSKICSNCGCKKSVLSLSDRVFHCDKCGIKIDRDMNAAKNLTFTDDYSLV